LLDSGAGVNMQKMEEEDAKSFAPLLGHGCEEQTYLAWWD